MVSRHEAKFDRAIKGRGMLTPHRDDPLDITSSAILGEDISAMKGSACQGSEHLSASLISPSAMSTSEFIWSAARVLGLTLATHPWETSRIYAVMDPSAKLVTEPFKKGMAYGLTYFKPSWMNESIQAYQRGLIPHLLESSMVAVAKTFLQEPVFQFLRKYEPVGPRDLDVPRWFAVSSHWLWRISPHLFIQNVTLLLAYPLMLLNTIASVPALSRNMSLIEIARLLVKRHGITGLYAGLIPKLIGTSMHTLLIQPCTSMVYNKLMEWSTASIEREDRQEQGERLRKSTRFNIIVSSSYSYLMGCLLMIPLDTITTEMQISAIGGNTIPTMKSVANTLWKQHGLRLFSIGAIPQFAKYAINAAVLGYLLSRR